MLYWVLYMTGLGVLGIVFAMSVRHKVADFARFRANLAAYQLFPLRLLGIAAPLVVGLEIAAIVALLLPVGPGLWLAFGLLSLYTVALTINLLRGKTSIDCGCGDQPTPISVWLLVRNGALLLLAFPHSSAGLTPGFWEWLLVVAMVAMLTLFYLTLEQLLINQHTGGTQVG